MPRVGSYESSDGAGEARQAQCGKIPAWEKVRLLARCLIVVFGVCVGHWAVAIAHLQIPILGVRARHAIWFSHASVLPALTRTI